MGAQSGLIPATVDLVGRRNGDLTRSFRFSSAPGVIFDLTGWRASMQVRNQPNESGTPLVSLSSGAAATAKGSTLLLSGLLGAAELTLTRAEMAALPGSASPLTATFVYDLIMTLEGYSAPWVSGVLYVEPGVTV